MSPPLHTLPWYSLVYLTGKPQCLVPATQQDSELLQVNTQQKHAFLKKRDTSRTGRGSISHRNSWCPREKQIDSRVQKPPSSASTVSSYPKQRGLRSVLRQSQSAAISQTRTTAASEPTKLRYQTHVTQHKANRLLKQCWRRTPVVPVPPSSMCQVLAPAFCWSPQLHFSHIWCLTVLCSSESSYSIPVYIYSLLWGWFTLKPQC